MGTSIAVIIIASIINLIGFIWLVIVGFQRSVVWGIMVFLFSPLAAIVFASMHWFDAKKAFVVYMVSTIAMGIGFYMMFSQMDTQQLELIAEGIQSGEIQPNEAFSQYGKMDTSPDGANSETPAGETPAATESEIMAMADEQGDKQDDGAAPATNKSQPAATNPDEKADKSGSEDATDEKQTDTKKADDTSRYPSPGSIKPDPLRVKKKPTESPSIRVKLENIASYKGRYFIITTKDGNQHRGLLVKVSDTTLYLSRKLYGGDFEYHVAKKKVDHADMLKEEYVKDFIEK